MAEKLAIEMKDEEGLAWDRRQATIAARLLACCLGIPAEPAFDVSASRGRKGAKVKDRALGQGLFKDAFDLSDGPDTTYLQLLVVDETGRTKARSKQAYYLGHGLDLLERLPLPLSPGAEGWIRNCLGEGGDNHGG
jgi:hypothetical protein